MRRGRHQRGGHAANHERWLLTYADLITLLLIFFVIMYSVTSLNISKFHDLAQSLNEAMGSAGTILSSQNSQGSTGILQQTSVTSSANSQTQQVNQAGIDNLYRRIEQYIRTHHLQSQVTAYMVPQGVRVSINAQALFPSGSDVLQPDALTLLDGLTPLLQQVTNDIEVQGFTDNVPIRTAQYPSNWFLSVARSAMVADYLTHQGIDPTRLVAMGYSKYRPVASNATAAGRQRNRRVDLLVLRSGLSAAY